MHAGRIASRSAPHQSYPGPWALCPKPSASTWPHPNDGPLALLPHAIDRRDDDDVGWDPGARERRLRQIDLSNVSLNELRRPVARRIARLDEPPLEARRVAGADEECRLIAPNHTAGGR